MRLSLLALALLHIAGPALAAEDAMRLVFGVQKQLLVDDYVITRTKHVRRVLGRVEKANEGKPIFTAGGFYGTVLHEEDQFNLWFRKFNQQGYGYAESSDGLHFRTKADLSGINFAGDVNLAVEFNRGESVRLGHRATMALQPRRRRGIPPPPDLFNDGLNLRGDLLRADVGVQVPGRHQRGSPDRSAQATRARRDELLHRNEP